MNNYINKCIEECNIGNYDASQFIYTINGMSNFRVRALINKICKNGKNYLEIGTYMGSTFCSAINNSSLEKAYCLDYYSDFDKINNSKLGLNSKNVLIENINKTPHNCQVEILDENVYSFPFSSIKEKIDILFYDGPHEKENCVPILNNIYDILSDEFILMVDDWAHPPQAEAIREFIAFKNIKTVQWELPSSGTHDSGNTPNYFNGFFIAICNKNENS